MAKIEGKGAPTLTFEGQVGDIYTDTDTGIQYECVQSYTSTDTIISKGDREYKWKKIEASAGGGVKIIDFNSVDCTFDECYNHLLSGGVVYLKYEDKFIPIHNFDRDFIRFHVIKIDNGDELVEESFVWNCENGSYIDREKVRVYLSTGGGNVD